MRSNIPRSFFSPDGKIAYMNKQYTIGMAISYAAIAFNIVSGLLYTPWMVRTLGADQYALYALAISVINIFLMDFGIGAAVTKFLSNYYARGEYAEADRFMGVVYKTFIAISCGILLVLSGVYCFLEEIYANLTPAELSTFKILFIIVACYSVLSLPLTSFNGTLMANERFIELKACNLGQKVLSVALIILFLLMGWGVYAMVLAHAATNILFYSIKYWVIRRKTRQRVDWPVKDRGLVKQLFNFSAWVTVMGIAQRCIFNIMPTIIAAMLNTKAVAIFSIASVLEGFVFTFADAINGMFMPKVSRILANENESQLTQLMIRVGRFHIFTLGAIYVGFICLGSSFVNLWMGEDYTLVYSCALFLIFPSLIYVPQQVATVALLAKDIVRAQAIIYVAMGVVNLALSVILIPILGITGAALSICLSYLLKTAALNYLYKRELKINLRQYFTSAYARWLPIAVGITLVAARGVSYLPLNSWIAFIPVSAAVAVLYVLTCWILWFNSEEKGVFASIFQRK